MAEVTANPNLLEFPTDIDGITSELQRAGLRTAQRVHDTDQLALVLSVYKTLILHTQALQARNEEDKAEYLREEEARIAAQEAEEAQEAPKAE